MAGLTAGTDRRATGLTAGTDRRATSDCQNLPNHVALLHMSLSYTVVLFYRSDFHYFYNHTTNLYVDLRPLPSTDLHENTQDQDPTLLPGNFSCTFLCQVLDFRE